MLRHTEMNELGFGNGKRDLQIRPHSPALRPASSERPQFEWWEILIITDSRNTWP